MSLKNRFFTLVALVVLAISVSSSATETNCSNASLNGSYALHATGKLKMSARSPQWVGSFLMEMETSVEHCGKELTAPMLWKPSLENIQ